MELALWLFFLTLIRDSEKSSGGTKKEISIFCLSLKSFMLLTCWITLFYKTFSFIFYDPVSHTVLHESELHNVQLMIDWLSCLLWGLPIKITDIKYWFELKLFKDVRTKSFQSKVASVKHTVYRKYWCIIPWLSQSQVFWIWDCVIWWKIFFYMPNLTWIH